MVIQIDYLVSRANFHDSRLMKQTRSESSCFGSTLINYEIKSPKDVRVIKTDNKIVKIICNLIETYHLSLRKGCGDMKIQDTVLAVLYISCHVALNIAFKRLKTSHV